jgi:hypothetical protein
MYFDQPEDREGHGHHSLPPAPSEEQEMKNTCILISVANPGYGFFHPGSGSTTLNR